MKNKSNNKIHDLWFAQIKAAQQNLDITMNLHITYYLIDLIIAETNCLKLGEQDFGTQILQAIHTNNQKLLINSANHNLLSLGFFIKKSTELDYKILLNKYAYKSAAAFTINNSRDKKLYNELHSNLINMLDCLLYHKIQTIDPLQLQILLKHNSKLAKSFLG